MLIIKFRKKPEWKKLAIDSFSLYILLLFFENASVLFQCKYDK